MSRSAPAEYRALISEFCSSSGSPLDSTSDPLVVDVVREDRRATIMPHPDDDGIAIIDIDLMVPQASVLRNEAYPILLRLNGLNRLGSGWMTALDDDELVLTRWVPVTSVDGGELAAILEEGFLQAEALAIGFKDLGEFASKIALPQSSEACIPSNRV